MEFTEAIEIIKNIVPESSVNEYDGIMVKRLEASNTLDEGRTTNQTHIAISGDPAGCRQLFGSFRPF